MKGYKVFNGDWTCYGGFQYEVGKTYEMDDDPICCKKGFHFCEKLIDCLSSVHDFDTSFKIAEVEAYGKIYQTYDIYCTNKIKIIKEIPWSDAFNMIERRQLESFILWGWH